MPSPPIVHWPGSATASLNAAADPKLRDGARPAVAPRAALVAEAAQVLALVAEQVAIARDVEARRTPAVVVLVLESLELPVRADAEVMVHEVVAELAGAAAESSGPHVGRGAHEQPRRVERGRAEKHDLRRVVRRLVRDGVDDRTPVARLRSLSYSTSLTIANGFSVRRPVATAAGSVDDCVLKYAP